MDLDEAVTTPRDVVAGIGFRHAAPSREIVGLIRQALEAAAVPESRLRALATADDRVDKATFQEAASTFGCEAIGMSPDALRQVDGRVQTRSARIEAQRGVGSLAEAAALAAAGADAVLILPRISTGQATCALASARRVEKNSAADVSEPGEGAQSQAKGTGRGAG